MSDLIGLLLPEMIGLIFTPAAVIGCVLLLQSRRPIANAATFGAGFVFVYVQLCVAALLGGAAEPGSTSKTVAHWAGLVIGVVFLAAGAALVLRRPTSDAPPPGLLTELESAGPRRAFTGGLVLAILNPNVVIMLSGMSLISSSQTTVSSALAGAALLILAAAMDFIVPIGIYIVSGNSARTRLGTVKQWMMRNNRGMTIGVLLGFGVLFTVRGVINVT